jgi:hypothetical protein
MELEVNVVCFQTCKDMHWQSHSTDFVRHMPILVADKRVKRETQANKSQLVWKKGNGVASGLDTTEQYEVPATGWEAIGPLDLGPTMAAYLHALTFKGPHHPLSPMLAAYRGRLVYDLVELLSHKTIPGKVFLSPFSCL